MTDALERKRAAIIARREATTFPGEVKACDEALARLEASSPTRAAVTVRALAEHQRRAWLCLVDGAGRLTKKESSFLHNMRERRFASPSQLRWLDDLALRIQWEKTL